MTEDEWLSCSHPTLLFSTARKSGVADRKLILAGCAIYRSVLEVFVGVHWRRIIELVERWADGDVDDVVMSGATERYRAAVRCPQDYNEVTMASAVLHLTGTGEEFQPDEVVSCCGRAYARALAGSGAAWSPTRMDDHFYGVWPGACAAIRDVVGPLPLRRPPVDPYWLTSTVVALARTMYDSRDFTAMPILGDALEDANCNDAEVLSHCRGEGTHVRGCWVVDGLMGLG